MKFLELPEHLRPKKYKVRSASLYYGAGHVLQKYLSLPLAPWDINGFWQHGTVPSFRMISAQRIAQSTGKMSKEILYLVARSDESEFIRREGYQAEAIGLPIAYVAKPQTLRISDSLLVMPSHSTKDSKLVETDWTIEYARFVESLIGRFSKITVCLHGECMASTAVWTALKALPVEFVVGASVDDASSLHRMAWLFSTFEYVCSNRYGSQMEYAAAFGAKPSICGPNKLKPAQDLLNEPFYRANPEFIISPYDGRISLSDAYGFLQMSSPEKASFHREWGEYGIGAQNRRDKSELIDMLHLRWFQEFGPMRLMPQRALRKARKFVSSFPRSVA